MSAWAQFKGCRGPHLLTYEASGLLYGVANGKILRVDAREAFSTSQEEAPAELQLQELETVLPLPASPSWLDINAGGSLALVTGTCTIQGLESPEVAVVELGRPHSSSHLPAKCKSFPVDRKLFSSRPGLKLLHAAWHPGSYTHFALLTSDQTWRLYHTERLSDPEQIFELAPRWRRAISAEDENPVARPVAFAFGASSSWERFTVFFVCADSSVLAFCPVVPFGVTLPVSQLARLQSTTEGNATGQAWLQTAFPQLGDMQHRYGDACTAVVTLSAAGVAQTFVLAGNVQPSFAQGFPACQLSGNTLVATQQEVRMQPSHTLSLLQMDCLQLQGAAVPLAHSRPALLAASAVPEQIFCILQRGAYVLTLPWLPVLAAHLAGVSGKELSHLPPATEEKLCTTAAGAEIVGAAVVGDSWTQAVLVAEQLLSPLGRAGNVPAEISRSLQSRYGELLAGTGLLRMPEAAGPTGSKTPEGQHLLAASIKELREAHVLYIHTANHDLKQRLEEMHAEAGNSAAKARQQQVALKECEDKQQAIVQRLKAARELQSIMEDRLTELSALHWGLSGQLSQAEADLRDRQLPELEEQASAVKAHVTQLKGAANGAVTQAKARRARLSPIKPADALLIRCHDMLHTQDEGIRHCLESLRLVEDAVAAAHAQQPVQLP
eukprot:jgi/Astpho2/1339/Aster-x0997